MKDWSLGVSSALFSYKPIQGSLQECADAGFSCVEIVMRKPDDSFREYAESIAKEAKEAGISVRSVHLPFGFEYDVSEANEEKRLDIVQKVSHLIDLASPLGAKVAVIHGSYEPIKPEEREEKILACIESLKTLVAKCKEYGMELAIECLPRTCIGNCSDEILRIVEAVEGLRVCFDTNHLTIEDPMNFMKKVGKYIITTHVSDYDMVDERHWLPGKGCNDWFGLVTGLEAAGYDGPILFEVSNKPGNEFITPKSLADNWRSLMDSFKDK
jgi:sugar phosphate isomerase/epimerase